MPNPITKSKKCTTAFLTIATAFVLCGGPQMAVAQNPAPPAQPTQSQPDSQAQNAQTPDQQTNATQQPEAAQQPVEQTQSSQDQSQGQSQSEAAAQQQQQTSRPGMVDPSKGPLTPAPSSNEQQQTPAMTPDNLPDAPSASQQQQPATDTTAPQRPTKPRSTQPVGVGTAQQAPTAGGAASKPAGAAIAPAKQKQYRSLLIKIGAIAGAGAALGTVFALSRGTKSTPPGAGR